MTSRDFAFGVLGSEWAANGLFGLSSRTKNLILSSTGALASWSVVCTGVFGVSALQTGLVDGGGVVRRGGTWFVRDGGGEAGALPILDVRFNTVARGSSGSSSSEKVFSSTTFPNVLGAVEESFGLKRTRATGSGDLSCSSSESDSWGSRLARFLSLAVRGGVGSDAVDAERLRLRRGRAGGGGGW